MVRVLSWNLFHGRDFPPDPALRSWRSRLLRLSERNATHLQVNRSLLREFASVLATAEWDLALLQECRPRWADDLAAACAAEAHVSLTSRNSLAPLRALLAWLNPDLTASAEGGSNVTLVRGQAISERRELVLATEPERRTMAFTRIGSGLAVANLHASTGGRSGPEILRGAKTAIEWAAGAPLLLGGDFNLRPARAPEVFEELRELGLGEPTEQNAIDHLLARGLTAVEPAASWAPERRERIEDGLAIRLSDHAPVVAAFA